MTASSAVAVGPLERSTLYSDEAVFANPRVPWERRDALSSAVIVALGVVILGACWYGVSGEDAYDDQRGWLYGSLAGAAIAGVGLVCWVLPGLRRLRRLQRAVFADLRMVGFLPEVVQVQLRSPVAEARSIAFTTADMTRVHTADCQLLLGKGEITEVSADEIVRLGLRECGMCSA